MRFIFLFLPSEQWTVLHHRYDQIADFGDYCVVFRMHEHAVNELNYRFHVAFDQSACGNCRRSKSYTAGHKRRLIVKGNHVFVRGNVGLHQGLFGCFSCACRRMFMCSCIRRACRMWWATLWRHALLCRTSLPWWMSDGFELAAPIRSIGGAAPVARCATPPRYLGPKEASGGLNGAGVSGS